jgi:hypothetical protein
VYTACTGNCENWRRVVDLVPVYNYVTPSESINPSELIGYTVSSLDIR